MKSRIDALPPDAKFFIEYSGGHKAYLLDGPREQDEFVVAVVESPSGKIWKMRLSEAQAHYGNKNRNTYVGPPAGDDGPVFAPGEFYDSVLTEEESLTVLRRGPFRRRNPDGRVVVVLRTVLPSGEVIETERTPEEIIRRRDERQAAQKNSKRSKPDDT